MLPLFASQAGTAIANARASRDEQRARDRLEAWSPPRQSAWWSWTLAPAMSCR
ncbi:MAG: hypothetical protein OXQ94_12635 [Gemmatimonadota bacterium]|nr:hypothetical protein [Gemmatimonadota bacterium]MDE2872519.1 hypothetical protein [Gemmatimonadota bacterium]